MHKAVALSLTTLLCFVCSEPCFSLCGESMPSFPKLGKRYGICCFGETSQAKLLRKHLHVLDKSMTWRWFDLANIALSLPLHPFAYDCIGRLSVPGLSP